MSCSGRGSAFPLIVKVSRLLGQGNLQAMGKKIEFHEIINAWKMFPAYISSKVLLMEYLQNYAVLIDFHWLGLSAHFTD